MATLPNVPVPDSQLVGRMAAGEDVALGDLYDRYGKMVYALALAILRVRLDAQRLGRVSGFHRVALVPVSLAHNLGRNRYRGNAVT
jgi:hypothetical protein